MEDKELFESDLDNIRGGITYEEGKEQFLKEQGLFRTSKVEELKKMVDSGELSIEELDTIMAGLPNNDMNNPSMHK